jgi:hypothetical protein
MTALDKSPEEIDVFCLEELFELELKLKPQKLLNTTYFYCSSLKLILSMLIIHTYRCFLQCCISCSFEVPLTAISGIHEQIISPMDKHQFLVRTSRSCLRFSRMELWRNSLPQGGLEKMKSLKSSVIFSLLLGIAWKQVCPL